jgi:hypothetical protein
LDTFKAIWEGYQNPITGIVEAVQALRTGKFTFELPNGLGGCTGTTFVNSERRGTWSFACDDKRTASGSLVSLGTDRGAIGNGIDSLGRKIKFEIGALNPSNN